MMKWTISYLPDKSIIRIETEGEVTAEELNEMVKQAKETGLQFNSMRFLVDHRKIVLKLQFMDVYNRPHTLYNFEFPRNSKIAQVFPESEHKSFRFFETVSQNRGYQVRIFKDINEAMEWLIGE